MASAGAKGSEPGYCRCSFTLGATASMPFSYVPAGERTTANLIVTITVLVTRS